MLAVMWRTSLLAVLAATAAASDDQSLMQQAVGVAVTSAELQTAVARIDDEISKIPHKGKANQMAFDALMANVKSTDKLDDDAKNVLGQIVELLDSILNQLQASNLEDQNELNEIIQTVVNCNTASDAADVAAKADVATTETNHSDCRVTQLTLDDDRVTVCQTMTYWLGQVVDQMVGICSFSLLETNDLTASQIEAWEHWFTKGEIFFVSKRDEVASKTEPCIDAETASNEQKSACDQAQRIFELKFCLWRSERITRCSNLDNCHSNAVSAHNGRLTAVHADAAQRMLEAKIIIHVKCLLNNLLANPPVTDTTACDSQSDPSGSDYDVTDPTYDDKVSCNTHEVAPYPGQGGTGDGTAWHTERYSDFNHAGNKAGVVDTGLECPSSHPECHCDHGTPASGDACANHQTEHESTGICEACDSGFTLSAGGCYPGCQCDHGTPASGDACAKHQIDHQSTGICEACDSGFTLQGGGCQPNSRSRAV